MKKVFLIATFWSLLSRLCFGGNVSPEKAALVAKNFCYERAGYEINFAGTGIDSKLAYQRLVEGKVVYYVFNTSDYSFVIVSGDDRVVPVLGYSFESDWSEDPLPVQLIDYLENSERQILDVRDHNLPENEEIRCAWTRLTTTSPSGLYSHKSVNSYVAPLLFSTWHQSSPFNNICPLDTLTGLRAAVGCVATAMAQIMYYYRWPTIGVGSKGYTSTNFGYLFADFGNTTYKWDQMTNAATAIDSATAMATLCYHCGISVHMFYTTSGSGANNDSVVDALKNNFRYSQDLQMVEKENYSDTAWIDMLKEQLNARKLMHYSGFHGSGSGHSFVCDGYQDDYFHFNWGWGGSYNGYYYLTSLNPGTWNFTDGQEAIIDIYPEGAYPPNCGGTANYISSSGSIDDGSGPQDYTGNNDCYYLIAPEVDPYDSISNITVKFDRFDTEPDNDILTIYDGSTPNSPVIGTWSGDNLPPAITSSGNKVLLHFLTNNSQQRNGWYLTYKSKRPVYCAAFETITSPNGTIEDGSGAKNYNNGCFCRWIIHPPNAQKINLSFYQFSLENGGDYVEVYSYDTLSGNANLLGHFTGHNLPPDLSSATGAMFIDFKTNENVTDLGWRAHFTSNPFGILENNGIQNLSIFPNPADQNVDINFTTNGFYPIFISLITSSGIEIISLTCESTKRIVNQRINLQNIPQGLYFIRVRTNHGYAMRKLIVQ